MVNVKDYLSHINNACMNCDLCGLGGIKAKNNRSNVEYDPHLFSNYMDTLEPKVMILCFNPSWDEIVNNGYFKNNIGHSLRKLLDSSIYDIDSFYVTSLVKCYGNVDDNSVSKCINYLNIEINTINPKLIVTFDDRVLKYVCDGNNDVGKLMDSIFGIKLLFFKYDDNFPKYIKALINIMHIYMTPF